MHSKDSQNIYIHTTKFGLLVWKYTTWQPCHVHMWHEGTVYALHTYSLWPIEIALAFYSKCKYVVWIQDACPEGTPGWFYTCSWKVGSQSFALWTLTFGVKSRHQWNDEIFSTFLSRVTKLGHFSPTYVQDDCLLWTVFYYCSGTNFGQFFEVEVVYLLILTKSGLGYIFGDSCINSSGHPEFERQVFPLVERNLQKMVFFCWKQVYLSKLNESSRYISVRGLGHTHEGRFDKNTWNSKTWSESYDRCIYSDASTTLKNLHFVYECYLFKCKFLQC
jgi:hypothetical protein